MPEIDASTARAWRSHLGARADLTGLRERLASGTLAEAFHERATAGPDRPGLAIGTTSLSHGELDLLAGRFAAQLAARGVRPGEVVLISAPTSLAMVVAYLGSLRVGAVLTLANPTYAAAELEHLIADAAPVLVIASESVRERIESARALTARLGLLVVDEHAGPDDLSDDLGHLSPHPVAVVDSQSPAILAYTSGTTGVPKSVPLTHANLLSSIRAAMLAWDWAPDDVLVHALPLVHQHGLGGLHATLLAGSRLVLVPRFEPEGFVATLEAERATVLFAVPTMYQRLVESPAARRFPRLRLAVSGSAPLSPALARQVEAVVGQLPLERYGTTETGLDVSNPLASERRPGTIGFALPGVEARVVDGSGTPVPDGQDGEIVLRGPQVFAGYRGDPAATERSFFPDGWFRTGDVGRVDADGYLSITGRSKELIISGGMNIYPREVELALETVPAAIAVGVVGLPSEQWGEEVVAAVVAAEPGQLDLDALAQAARHRLAGYKRPKRFVEIDALPVNPMGKLQRAQLAELVLERLSQEEHAQLFDAVAGALDRQPPRPDRPSAEPS